MIVKKHSTNGRLIMTVVDSDIIGQKFENEKHELDLSSNFYKGHESTEEEILSSVKEAYSIICVGKDSCNIMINNNFASENEIIFVQDTPYLNILFGH